MKTVIPIVLIVLTSSVGCFRGSIAYDLSDEHMTKCRKLWKYQTAMDTFEIKVLQFSPSGHYSLAMWPNFVIGVAQVGDTVGLVDYNFKGELIEGTRLSFGPAEWSDVHLEHKYPAYRIFRKKELTNLNCAVSIVYLGEIIKSSSNIK